MRYSIITFKKASQNQTTKINNAKPQLLLHQLNNFNVIEQLPILFACFMFCLNITGCSMPTHTHIHKDY